MSTKVIVIDMCKQQPTPISNASSILITMLVLKQFKLHLYDCIAQMHCCYVALI